MERDGDGVEVGSGVEVGMGTLEIAPPYFCSLFPVPCSLFPVPCSYVPIRVDPSNPRHPRSILHPLGGSAERG
jgi:hypothetical protein